MEQDYVPRLEASSRKAVLCQVQGRLRRPPALSKQTRRVRSRCWLGCSLKIHRNTPLPLLSRDWLRLGRRLTFWWQRALRNCTLNCPLAYRRLRLSHPIRWKWWRFGFPFSVIYAPEGTTWPTAGNRYRTGHRGCRPVALDSCRLGCATEPVSRGRRHIPRSTSPMTGSHAVRIDDIRSQGLTHVVQHR